MDETRAVAAKQNVNASEVQRLLDLWARLKVECTGIRVRGQESAYQTIRREFMTTSGRIETFVAFTRILKMTGILKEPRQRKVSSVKAKKEKPADKPVTIAEVASLGQQS